MGYMQHDAVIAVVYEESPTNVVLESWRESLVDSGFAKYIVGPVVGVNGYTTWVFTPDGSKEGWEHSDHADELREEFKRIVAASGRSDFIHVRFGGDYGMEVGARIVQTDREAADVLRRALGG